MDESISEAKYSVISKIHIVWENKEITCVCLVWYINVFNKLKLPRDNR